MIVTWREGWQFELADQSFTAQVMLRDPSGHCADTVAAHLTLTEWNQVVATVAKSRRPAKAIDGLRLARDTEGTVVLTLKGQQTGFSAVEWRQFVDALETSA